MKKRKLAMKADTNEGSTTENGVSNIVDKDDTAEKANVKEKGKGSKNSTKSKQKALTPQIKSNFGVVNTTPKLAKKGSNMKARRRSEPPKMAA